MGITSKTRKILWGRSGNRCAICKCELAMPSKEVNNDVVIGDECHIVARNPGGPRGDYQFPQEKLDHYQNLILLCKVHHKVIDDDPNSYSVEGLKKLKVKHEEWVRDNLRKEKIDRSRQEFQIAERIIYGKEVLSIVAGAHFYDFDYDEPEDREILDLISMFLQFAQDFVDIGDEIESGQRVEIGFDLTKHIKDLEQHGYLVFGIREQRNYKFANKASLWDVAVLRILKKNNPFIKANI